MSASARTALSFILVTLIWGSTWLVIKDQIADVPPSWTVTYRFILASVGMGVLALVRRESLALTLPAMRLAALVGVFQFCLNFQLVYRAEHYLTSGIVAVFYALLMVPNAVLSKLFLDIVPSPRFLAGSLVAISGIAMLLLHEYRIAPPGGSVTSGAVLAFAALLSASAANVLQASELAKKQQVVPLIFWAMVWGTAANIAISLFVSGPPIFDPRPAYMVGIAYLALFGSVITFPLYFGLIRNLGAGRAAYSGVAVPVVAMALSTLFEGYRWGGLAIGGSLLAMAGLLIALSRQR